MSKKRAASLRIRKSRKHSVGAADSPRSWFRDAAGTMRQRLEPQEIASILAGGTGVLWVDIDVASAKQHALLTDVFKFHPLSIEDTLSAEGRVKFEEFADYALTVVRGVRFVEETADLYDIETFNLWCFVGGIMWSLSTVLTRLAWRRPWIASSGRRIS